MNPECCLTPWRPEAASFTVCLSFPGAHIRLWLSCAGELGKSLQRLAGQRTASLRPAHQYVPWVVVNGVPLLEDADNLMKYICVAYTGRDRYEVIMVCMDTLTGRLFAKSHLTAVLALYHLGSARLGHMCGAGVKSNMLGQVALPISSIKQLLRDVSDSSTCVSPVCRPHVCYDIPNPTLKVEQSQDQQAAAWQRQQWQGHRHCLRHQQPT